MPEFFALSAKKQEDVPSVFGLNAEDRKNVEEKVDAFLEDLVLDSEDARDAAADNFYAENNEESKWVGVVTKEKMEGALNYGKAFIQYSNSLDESLVNEAGDIREILPDMVSISNNSTITNKVAMTIMEKFTPEELRDFKSWMRIAKTNIQSIENRAKRFRY